jgi:hypothetical protein
VLIISSSFSTSYVTNGPLGEPANGPEVVPVSGTNSTPTGLQHKNVSGAVVGAGFDVRCGPIHILPQVRYTRWTREHFNDVIDNSRQDQLEFLVGIGR